MVVRKVAYKLATMRSRIEAPKKPNCPPDMIPTASACENRAPASTQDIAEAAPTISSTPPKSGARAIPGKRNTGLAG